MDSIGARVLIKTPLNLTPSLITKWVLPTPFNKIRGHGQERYNFPIKKIARLFAIVCRQFPQTFAVFHFFRISLLIFFLFKDTLFCCVLSEHVLRGAAAPDQHTKGNIFFFIERRVSTVGWRGGERLKPTTVQAVVVIVFCFVTCSSFDSSSRQAQIDFRPPRDRKKIHTKWKKKHKSKNKKYQQSPNA